MLNIDLPLLASARRVIARLRLAASRWLCPPSERERQLESELRKFFRAVEQSPSTVMITDLEGNIEYVNPKFTELTGYTLDEVRGRNPRFLKSGHTPPEEYARMWQTISQGGEWRGELYNVKKNGEHYWESALMAPIKDASGQITHYISLKEDITARKAAEDALRAHAEGLERRVAERTTDLERERALLRAILDAMGEGVLYVEGDTIVYGNRALAEIMGLPAERLTGGSLSALYADYVRGGPPFERLRAELDEALDRSPTWSGELVMSRPDGTQVEIALVTAQVNDVTGAPLGRVSVLRDVSRERNLQEQRERFLRHAAHELRTPLSNFKTRLYLLRRQPERLFAHLAVMERVTDEINQLVEDLLDIFRLQRDSTELQPEPLDLGVVVRDLPSLCAAEAEEMQAELSVIMSDAPVFVCADDVRLRQALVRLVTSALQTAGQGGRVEVALMERRNGDRRWALVRVRDNGATLSPDELAHVFDPFYRATEGAGGNGASLGLTLARQIIELHAGQITVESAAERGTVYNVWLPLCEDCPENCTSAVLAAGAD